MIPIDEPSDGVLRAMLVALPVVPLDIRNTEAMRGAYRAAVGPARAAGAAKERARIVAMLRAQIDEHQTESRRCYFAEAAAANDKCAAVLDALADRIERGET